MAVVPRRSTMTLFSDSACQYSHRVRMVRAEKGGGVEIQVGAGRRFAHRLQRLRQPNEHLAVVGLAQTNGRTGMTAAGENLEVRAVGANSEEL